MFVFFSDQMLMKLSNVLGCIKGGNSFINPDPTYVLTYDNLMKMLAIHMRFRYVHWFVFVHHVY